METKSNFRSQKFISPDLYLNSVPENRKKKKNAFQVLNLFSRLLVSHEQVIQ